MVSDVNLHPYSVGEAYRYHSPHHDGGGDDEGTAEFNGEDGKWATTTDDDGGGGGGVRGGTHSDGEDVGISNRITLVKFYQNN